MKKTITIYIILLALLSASCKKEDLTPSYIEITKEDLQNSMDMSNFNLENNTTYSSEELAAIARQNFTHVVLLVNGKSLGVYTLPAKIPVLASDSARLYIMPCIKMDGMSTTIRNYEGIVAPCITTVFLKKGETYTFKDNPIRFNYQKGTQLPLLELFNNSTGFKPDSVSSTVPIVLETVDGQNIGSITLNGQQELFEIIGPEIELPSLGEDLFFEMDYKMSDTVEMFVGIDLNYNTIWNARALIGIRNPINTWNKIYVNLTKVVGDGGQGNTSVKAKIRLSGTSLNKEQVKFYFDNMKVIYVKQ
jgi:hypothetical protein